MRGFTIVIGITAIVLFGALFVGSLITRKSCNEAPGSMQCDPGAENFIFGIILGGLFLLIGVFILIAGLTMNH
jgi:hypothetical protein